MFLHVVYISMKQWATVLDSVGTSSSTSSEWTVVVSLQNGLTAMMYACLEGHEHVLEALVNGGAAVDIQDEVIPYITWQ